jgi:hypothetical protein
LPSQLGVQATSRALTLESSAGLKRIRR